jgi:hypothetical protein
MQPPPTPDSSQPYGTPPVYPPSQPYGTPAAYPPSQPYGVPPYPPGQPYGAASPYPPSQPYGTPPVYPGPQQYVPPMGYLVAQPYGLFGGMPLRKTNGLAVTSMVLGIIGTVFLLCPGLNVFLSPLLGILAVIFGAVALNQVRGGTFTKGSQGMAIAGFVTGIVAMLFDIVIIVVTVFSTSAAALIH